MRLTTLQKLRVVIHRMMQKLHGTQKLLSELFRTLVMIKLFSRIQTAAMLLVLWIKTVHPFLCGSRLVLFMLPVSVLLIVPVQLLTLVLLQM